MLGRILKANPKTGRTSIGFDTMAFSMKSEIFLKKTSKKTCSLSLSQCTCMGKKRLCFIGGLSMVVSAACLSASNANEGLEVNYGRNWSPYVTVRGGWLFGEMQYDVCMEAISGRSSLSVEKNIKSAWSGSAEFGGTYDDRVFVGLELEYFTGKMKDVEGRYWVAGGAVSVDAKGSAKIGNFFTACNVTLRQDLNERIFTYGGVGVGMVRSRCSGSVEEEITVSIPPAVPLVRDVTYPYSKSKWRFLGQAFAGFGVYLNDNWQLAAGYRLRYVGGSFRWDQGVDGILKVSERVEDSIVHAAEVGLTYQF